MRVVVLVPRRADGGRRDELWAWVKARWKRAHPRWRVYEGHHDGDQPFNRSLAINRAAKKAGKFDVAVIADADSFVGSSELESAVVISAETGQMTMAYDRWCALDEEMTNRIMAGWSGDWWPGVKVAMTDTCSSMFAMTRALWDECEGFDERHKGWASEDVSHAHAARTFGDGWQRVAGECWHLWHPSAPRDDALVADNVALSDRYHAAAGDKDAMRALINERRR